MQMGGGQIAFGVEAIDAVAVQISETEIIFFAVEAPWLKMAEVNASPPYDYVKRKWKDNPCDTMSLSECIHNLATAIDHWNNDIVDTSTDTGYVPVVSNLECDNGNCYFGFSSNDKYFLLKDKMVRKFFNRKQKSIYVTWQLGNAILKSKILKCIRNKSFKIENNIGSDI